MREKLSAVLEPLSTVDANNDHFTKTGSGQTQGTLRGKRRFLAGNPREGNRLPWAREPNGQVETDLQPQVREHNIVICEQHDDPQCWTLNRFRFETIPSFTKAGSGHAFSKRSNQCVNTTEEAVSSCCACAYGAAQNLGKARGEGSTPPGPSENGSMYSIVDTPFKSHFYIKTIFLPRQARDKHSESTQKQRRFLAGIPSSTHLFGAIFI